mmetsp:Transcript_7416/g.19049  ORF Transcript_7416/g.19049 Transcript_7416/m.19049 type:complete len:657 (+) Transcript_7416:39-2009(+)
MSARANETYLALPTFVARNRKAVVSALIVMSVVSYQWESIKQHNALPTVIKLGRGKSDFFQLEPCVEQHVRRWDHGPARPLIQLDTNASQTVWGWMPSSTVATAVAAPRPDSASSKANSLAFKRTGLQQPTLALVGNEQMMVEVRKMVMWIDGEELPLPISSTATPLQSELAVIDLHSGTVKTVAKLRAPGGAADLDPAGCVTREEHWFAHRQHPGLIVRDIQFTNTLHQPITIEMPMLELPPDFTRPDNITFDRQKFTVLSRGAVGDGLNVQHADGTPERKRKARGVPARPLAFVYTKTKGNFTLQPRMSTRRLLLLQLVTPEEKGAATVDPQDVLLAVKFLDSITSPAALLKSHELAWSKLWPLQLKATGVSGHKPWSGQLSATLASFYYLLTALDLKLDLKQHGDDAHPSDGGCFVGTALRLASEMPASPTDLTSLNEYIAQWTHVLRQGGCKLASKDGALVPFRVVRAVAFGLLGVHVNPGGKTLYVADSTDFPRGLTVTVGPIHFNDHKIELSLTQKEITVLRLDTLSESLYTSSFRGALEPFTPHQSKRLPPHGVLVSNEVHDLELHWASGELDHGNAHAQHDEHSATGSYSRWLVGVLVAAVVAFHVFLIAILYRSDLCSSVDPLSLFNRMKHRVSAPTVLHQTRTLRA